MLSASLTKKQGGAFRAALIGYLKATIHGYDRAEYVIGAAALAAGIEKSSGYRLVNEMICSDYAIYECERASIKKMSDISDLVVKCVQVWQQNLEIKEMCRRAVPDTNIMDRFASAVDDGLVKCRVEDVCDAVIAPKEPVIEYTCKRMGISHAVFDVFFQHMDGSYCIDEEDGDEYDAGSITQSAMIRPEPRPVCPFFTTPPTDYGDAILALADTPLPLWAVRVDVV